MPALLEPEGHRFPIVRPAGNASREIGIFKILCGHLVILSRHPHFYSILHSGVHSVTLDNRAGRGDSLGIAEFPRSRRSSRLLLIAGFHEIALRSPDRLSEHGSSAGRLQEWRRINRRRGRIPCSNHRRGRIPCSSSMLDAPPPSSIGATGRYRRMRDWASSRAIDRAPAARRPAGPPARRRRRRCRQCYFGSSGGRARVERWASV